MASKVIDLLKGLKEKSIAEGKEEEVAYTKFQYWCSTSISELKDAIANEKEQIDELKDKLAGLEKKKASLEEEIEAKTQLATLSQRCHGATSSTLARMCTTLSYLLIPWIERWRWDGRQPHPTASTSTNLVSTSSLTCH